MPYVRYKSKDYAEWQLLSSISSWALSLQLKSWEWSKFPSLSVGEKFIWTLEKRTWTTVTAKERVLVTARSWDTMTLTRSFWWDTAIWFASDDYFCLHVNSDIIIDAQDEIARLESAKLNSAWWLRTALSNWFTYYTNWSWAETWLALWANWTYLKSNWPTAIPSWWTPPLDINWQTTTALNTADYIPFYDVSWTVNWKALISDLAVLFSATNAQASTWSNTTQHVTPLQLKKYYWPEPIAWTTYTASSASGTLWSTSWTTYLQARIWTIARTGTYTVTFTLWAWVATTWYWRIYKNGSVFWTERTVVWTNTTFAENLSFTEWDTISLWYKSWGWWSASVSDLSIKYDLVDQKAFTLA